MGMWRPRASTRMGKDLTVKVKPWYEAPWPLLEERSSSGRRKGTVSSIQAGTLSFHSVQKLGRALHNLGRWQAASPIPNTCNKISYKNSKHLQQDHKGQNRTKPAK